MDLKKQKLKFKNKWHAEMVIDTKCTPLVLRGLRKLQAEDNVLPGEMAGEDASFLSSICYCYEL